MMNYVDMSMINKILIYVLKKVLNKVYRNLEKDIKIYIFRND